MGDNLDLAINVLAAVFVVLAATTVCGRLARRLGQPGVVGEMVAGILLGPSLLGSVAPGLQHHLFPADVKSVLYVLSTIGLTFYMFLVGAALDHSFITRRSVQRAAVLATAGIVPTFLLAIGAAALFYSRLALPTTDRWVFMLFVGGALSITAFPMLARILEERGIANTPTGSLTLVAAAIDDAVAWILLAVVIAVGSAGHLASALPTVIGAVLFATLMLTIGRRLLRRLATRVERDGGLRHDTMAIVLLLVLAAGWLTDSIGVFSVFGGFVTGLAMPQSPLLREELRVKLMDLNAILLLPVFFAFSGLNTQLSGLGNGRYVLPMVVIVLVATVGKYVGCAMTVRGQGMSWRHASAIGGLMNARGLMILVFINVGLGYHLVAPQLFSILVVVAVVTTAAAMPIYRRSLPARFEDVERAHAEAQLQVARTPAGTPAAVQ
ncbi:MULTISPECIES: cation:proton antiporter [unclassified Micromonospora]|uniref:cation:proton antiporter n=1 Tax=unclassified Micromonospora TaxID=2617518 RepID=UPI00363E6078